jgi:uncharacterized protein (TIRG00374 family)
VAATRILRAVLGLAISAVAIALVLSRTDLAAVMSAIRAATSALLALTIVATCLDLACRTRRWAAILRPVKDVAAARVLGYLLIGYLANNVLPARMGELVRSHFAGDREHVSRATVLGTIVVERLIDTGVLVAIAGSCVVLLGVGGTFGVAIVTGGVLTIGLIAVVVVLQLSSRLSLRRWSSALGRWGRLSGIAARLRTGVAVAGSPRVLMAAIGWSVLAWSATIAGFVAAGWAIGAHPSVLAVALVASGTALSTAIPAGPGYIGTFELAGTQIGQLVGIDPTHALALTLVAHASVLALTSIGGGVALIMLSLDRSARSVIRSTEPATRVPPATD